MMASKPKKPAAPEPEKFPRKAIPCVSGASDAEKGRSFANLVTSPELAAYRVIAMMQPKNLRDEIDAPGMLATLREQAAAAQRGDLALAEAMLINQASALQALFVRLSERAMEQTHMPNLEGFMRMALRAQSQCRATLETLAAIKNPASVAFVRQANIAHGPQQVNNGTLVPSRAENSENRPNKLLAAKDGKRLDIGATGTASGANPTVEAVEAVDRAEDA